MISERRKGRRGENVRSSESDQDRLRTSAHRVENVEGGVAVRGVRSDVSATPSRREGSEKGAKE
jgi:hypothetical protein